MLTKGKKKEGKFDLSDKFAAGAAKLRPGALPLPRSA